MDDFLSTPEHPSSTTTATGGKTILKETDGTHCVQKNIECEQKIAPDFNARARTHSPLRRAERTVVESLFTEDERLSRYSLSNVGCRLNMMQMWFTCEHNTVKYGKESGKEKVKAIILMQPQTPVNGRGGPVCLAL